MSEQKIVIVTAPGNFWHPASSVLIRGDEDYAKAEYWETADRSDKQGSVLPQLLKEGWRVVDVYPGGNNAWLVVVEK